MARKIKRPKCYFCGRKPVRKGSFFCTKRCAAANAESEALHNGLVWDEEFQIWTEEESLFDKEG